ncbi:MAG: catalase/peroxidase HPI [Sphingomonadaceae bacterium]|nr:catalase/peroxidase HPI [Sphingomonadaceae bacterium]|tara:strand:- start:3880 stop:6072 length:2193 start_codon:yes stop_codon:yes gene_type:complete
MDAKTGEMSGCPMHGDGGMRALLGRTNKDWWPEMLATEILNPNGPSNPMGDDFDYAEAFNALDYKALKDDLHALMTDSQPWWPADYGHYGPFFIRMAWHAAGTYRTADGRGGANSGQQRFAPLDSWPDNGNLDKARRLLWPVKQKYGQHISWADLFILAGNVAIESMGGPIFGFGGGRADVFEPERDIYWGSEDKWVNEGVQTRIAPEHGFEQIEGPLAAIQMGLIYVNPEGPGGNPHDDEGAARDLRETFKRMAMNDEEIVALTAGGHTFGKAHGNGDASTLGAAPAGGDLAAQGFGWVSGEEHGGIGEHTVTSGIEGAWTNTPDRWSENYFRLLLDYDYELVQSPAGANQWQPIDQKEEDMAPAAWDSSKKVPTMMTTADMQMKRDPGFRKISEKFRNDHEAFRDAFARAWFKLTHRDMGPKIRYLGPEVPQEDLIWQDPVPEGTMPSDSLISEVKAKIADSGLTVSQLIKTAWASASTYRKSDHRGGANGARIALSPQKDWDVNEPANLQKVLSTLDGLRGDMSLADAIVLGGVVALEKAGATDVPFTGGRGDATQEQTDVESFDWMEPEADAFRNYRPKKMGVKTEEMMLDRASLLGLSVPEMTVLIGGLRVLGANHGERGHGHLTERSGQLTNDFFVHLYDMTNVWKSTDDSDEEYVATDRAEGREKWHATRADLVFGSNAELRAVGEVYAQKGGEEKFKKDFVRAWTKVMDADRFDISYRKYHS